MNRLREWGPMLLIVGLVALALDGLRSHANAATNSVNWRQERSIGIGEVISNPTSPASFTVAPGTRHAWISVWNNPVCWTMDGTTAPTASSGGKWPAGMVVKLENSDTGNYSELKKFKFINCAEGATEVRMMPTRDQRPSDQ